MNCPNCQQEMKRFKGRYEVTGPSKFLGIEWFKMGEWIPQCFECDDCDLREIDLSGEYLGGDQHAS